ncbi:MAG: hypothetical protein GY835_07585 [bacterium]|nr:hypothetical protein [bacterium]
MKLTTIMLLLVAIICELAGVADAKVRRDGIDVRLEGPARAASAGNTFRGVLVIRAYGDHVVSDIEIEGDGWQVTRFDPFARFTLPAGENGYYDFSATPADPTVPLRVSWSVDDEPFAKEFDLSRETFERDYEPMALNFAPGEALDVTGKEPSAWERLTPPTESDPTLDIPDDRDTEDLIVIEGYLAGFHIPSQDFYVPRGILVTCESSSSLIPQYVNTDEDGFFTFTVEGSYYDWTPDVQLTFTAGNAHAVVQSDTWQSSTRHFRSELFMDLEDPYYNLGIFVTTQENTAVAFYIAETLQRAWEYYDAERGFDISDVTVHFPEDDDHTYWIDNEIYIARAKGWDEGTICHEYGHHWTDDFMSLPDFDYCNGECDEARCTHCMWCQEDETIAWMEGIAQFTSRLATNHIAATFYHPAPAVIKHKPIESVDFASGNCTTLPPDPFRTEGFFGALMLDLADTDNEEDPSTPGYYDVADGLVDQVFEALMSPCPWMGAGAYPDEPDEFSFCFWKRFPEFAEDFWETAKNCGMEHDYLPPGGVSFTYWDPGTNTPSTDHTVTIMWNPPIDDLSGVAGYSITWDGSTPDTTVNLTGVNYITSDPLPAGSHNFRIRAVDRAGNWQDGANWIGPFIIMDGQGADLRYHSRPGWDYEVVPSMDTDATEGDVHVSVVLSGGQDNTYWNVAGRNGGDTASLVTSVSVSVDGDSVDVHPWPPMPIGSQYRELNRGPVTVPPGRHMFGMFLDSDEVNSETSENNNYRSGQWAWRPTSTLPVDEFLMYEPPAPPAGGFEHFGWEQPAFWNCDGYRISNYSTYQAVYVYPVSYTHDENYDIRLFGPEYLPESGFLNSIGESLRPGGYLDAVLVYGLNQGLDNCLVGVYNWEQGTGTVDYKLNRLQDTYIGGDYGIYPATLVKEQMLEIWSFFIDEPVTLKLSAGADDPPVYLGFFDGEFSTGGLLDAAQIEMAHEGEAAVINVYPSGGAICAAVAWRELDGRLYSPVDVTFEIKQSKPDLVAEAPSGWVAPLVPYPSHDPVYPWDFLDAPPYLWGNESSTYFYFGGRNESETTCPGFQLRSYVDGELLSTYTRNGVDPDGEFKFTGANASWIWGGRHMLSLVLDSREEVDEEFEDNNTFGRQWAWSPDYIGTDEGDDVNYLPNVFGGNEHYSGGYLAYNCCGWRTDEFSLGYTRFVSFYSLCDSETDVDLRIYEPYYGVDYSFGPYEVSSSLGSGEADFVIADLMVTGERYFDVGLVELEGDGVAYIEVDAAGGAALQSPVSFQETMAATEHTKLYWLQLLSGGQEVRLSPEAGNTVDLGIALVEAGDDFTKRLDTIENLSAWLAPPGEDEVIDINVDDVTDYALLVWRASTDGIGEACQFTIVVDEGGVGVDEPSAPLVTRLFPAVPNPFNPRTTISFDLHEERRVNLRVYDMAGRLVRTMIGGDTLPMGRHDSVWNGKDDSGRQVASGVYLYRLEAGVYNETRRMLLLK